MNFTARGCRYRRTVTGVSTSPRASVFGTGCPLTRSAVRPSRAAARTRRRTAARSPMISGAEERPRKSSRRDVLARQQRPRIVASCSSCDRWSRPAEWAVSVSGCAGIALRSGAVRSTRKWRRCHWCRRADGHCVVSVIGTGGSRADRVRTRPAWAPRFAEGVGRQSTAMASSVQPNRSQQRRMDAMTHQMARRRSAKPSVPRHTVEAHRTGRWWKGDHRRGNGQGDGSCHDERRVVDHPITHVRPGQAEPELHGVRVFESPTSDAVVRDCGVPS